MSPSRVKRANTPVASGPSSRSAAPRTMRARGQRATTSRVTASVPGAPSEDPDVDTPTSLRRSRASLHAGEPTSLALHANRSPLPLEPVGERLRVGADDRGDAHGGAPVAVIPLDPVAGQHLPLGRALVGLEPVHPVEPVHLPAGALPLEAVDRLHEAAAEAGGHVEVRAQHAHHRLALADAVELRRAELPVAEVARDPQGRAAAGRSFPSPKPQPAAAGARPATSRAASSGAGTAHGTSTRSVNERTRPSLRATSR